MKKITLQCSNCCKWSCKWKYLVEMCEVIESLNPHTNLLWFHSPAYIVCLSVCQSVWWFKHHCTIVVSRKQITDQSLKFITNFILSGLFTLFSALSNPKDKNYISEILFFKIWKIKWWWFIYQIQLFIKISNLYLHKQYSISNCWGNPQYINTRLIYYYVTANQDRLICDNFIFGCFVGQVSCKCWYKNIKVFFHF